MHSTVQKRIDDQCRSAQDSDFTKGVETPEVNDDDVDNVSPSAARQGLLRKVRGKFAIQFHSRYRPGKARHTNPGRTAQDSVPPALPRWRLSRCLLGQKVHSRRMRINVTISTEICVRAKSGAER